jgi:hypothetical protein
MKKDNLSIGQWILNILTYYFLIVGPIYLFLTVIFGDWNFLNWNYIIRYIFYVICISQAANTIIQIYKYYENEKRK